MKLTKTQIRRLIAEERAKLVTEQGESLIGETPSELESLLAAELGAYFEEAIAAEKYEGTGPTWEKEVSWAASAFHQAIIDSGALKSVLEMWLAVEEQLHDGQYA
jgi:hypothetical protein